MDRWRIVVSFSCGVLSLISWHYADLLARSPYPMGRVLFFLVAIMFILWCMVLAQDDGRIGRQ